MYLRRRNEESGPNGVELGNKLHEVVSMSMEMMSLFDISWIFYM